MENANALIQQLKEKVDPADRITNRNIDRIAKNPERNEKLLKEYLDEYGIKYQLDDAEQWVVDCQQLRFEIDETKGRIKGLRSLYKFSSEEMWGQYSEDNVDFKQVNEEICQLNGKIEILKGKLFRLENPDKF